MRIAPGDIVHIRQVGAGEPEFIRGRVTALFPGTNNDDWQGFYYRPIDDAGQEIGSPLFAYSYSVAQVEPAVDA